MFGFKTFDRHAALVGRMADTVGVDLAEEMQRGTIQPGELRSAVYRCRGCIQADACTHWMDDHPDGAEAAPGYCRNVQLFDMLAADRDR